jgi:hypothetical protein
MDYRDGNTLPVYLIVIYEYKKLFVEVFIISELIAYLLEHILQLVKQHSQYIY